MNREIVVLFLLISFSVVNLVFANDKKIVIFGEKITESEVENKANVIVITKEDIDKINPQTVYDILETIPGVSVKSFDIKHSTVIMGGFDSEKGGLNNVIMLNGRRITNPDMSTPDLSLIPVDMIERVEVYLGGGSVLFGDRATGGAINIVTKKPYKNSFTVKADGGSYGYYNTYAEGVFANERYSFIINADKLGMEGYRDNSEFYSGTISGQFSYYLDKLEITFDALYNDQRYGLPGFLTESDIVNYGRKHSNTPLDGGDDYSKSFGLKLSYDLSENSKIIFDSNIRQRNRSYYLYVKTNDELKTKIYQLYYDFKLNKKNYSNHLQIGVEYEKDDLETESTWSSSELDRKRKAIYFYDTFSIKKIFGEFGYRYSKLDDDYDTYNKSKDTSEKAYAGVIGYNITKNHKIYIKYDRSFRFPTTDEIMEYSGNLNDSLDTQVDKTYEIGFKSDYKKYFVHLSVYKQVSNNEIFTDPDAQWWLGDPANTNFDTEKKVFNMNTGYDDNNILLMFSYNYIDSVITEDGYDDSFVPLVSKHTIKATAGYRTKAGFGVYYFVRYYSDYYVGNDYKNDYDKMDGYAISDLKLEYKKKNYEIYFKVNNLFNEQYYSYVNNYGIGNNYYPAPERNYVAGIKVKF